jgi:3alpha(or 20beta)-hydroxysteroid dehydrogenase
MNRLEGKIALITGAARGMGAEHCRTFVANGAKVVVADILNEQGTQLARELGSSAAFVHLDVTDSDAWQRAVAFTLERFGRFNVLVNNAGILNYGTLGEYTLEQWQQILAINVTGAFLGIKASLTALKTAAPASIINVASIAGLQGGAGVHGYTASKFALRGLTKSVATELARTGVRCNAVLPGNVTTPMTADIVSPIPMAQPHDISPLLIYLASDESAFATGADFTIDGGATAGFSNVGEISGLKSSLD